MIPDNKFQDLKTFTLPPHFRGRSAILVQLWWCVQSTLFAWSPQFMYGWRRLLLRLFGAKIGVKVLVRPSTRITFPWKLSIGDYSWIGDHVELYTLGEVVIGTHTVVSQKCYLCTGSHDISSPSFDIFQKPIHIGSQVWIATDVYVAPGVTIGRGTVVGARSTVLSDLPEAMICYGNPAKPIKPRVLKAE
ncbi:MAG: colanic acid biosynthesis acetyltransferase WcaF [Anaerolineae bacterium]|nr:colanic acid biosynthesis acetyltransferase WcaF [Anaerolineae bacterium]